MKKPNFKITRPPEITKKSNTVAVTDPALQCFYGEIAASEARHDALFVSLAMTYFPDAVVDERLAELLVAEAQIIQGLTIRSALH